jgi:hypothetical protein
MMKTRLLFLSVFVSAAIAAGCDEKLSNVAGPSPNLEPTFSSIQRDIFESTDSAGRTACVACHSDAGGRTPSGGMNLTHDAAYTQLVNAAGRTKPGVLRVIPGDPANSYLIQKLEGAAGIGGRRMPFNGPPYLSDGQILIIKRWIEIGAPRD